MLSSDLVRRAIMLTKSVIESGRSKEGTFGSSHSCDTSRANNSNHFFFFFPKGTQMATEYSGQPTSPHDGA